MNRTTIGVAAAGALTVAISTLGAVAPASATTAGNGGGCTPGYWKNHTSQWEEANPGSTFEAKYQWSAPEGSVLDGITFPEALALQGGSDLDGASEILARAATASWLNAAKEGILFPLRRSSTGVNGEAPLKAMVRDALDSQDRETILALAAYLDDLNPGVCELGGPNDNAGSKGKRKA